MKTAISAILVAMACALPARAQTGENRYVERLEPFLQKTMQEAKVPGLAVGIVEAGRSTSAASASWTRAILPGP
jgi:hypothetical protein